MCVCGCLKVTFNMLIIILHFSLCIDYYALLNLKHNCSERDIEKSYMKLSRKYHPDKNKGNDEIIKKYNLINDGYSALRDPIKRRIYDLWGINGVEIYESGNQQNDDLTSLIFKKGKTLRINYKAELMDFHKGKVHEINIKRKVMCRCQEHGFGCEECNGKPTKDEDIKVKLAIEKGLSDGSVITFKNIGDASEYYAPGDIEVVVSCLNEGPFSRNGDNVNMKLDVSMKEALLGIKKEIVNFDGKKIKIDFKPKCSKDFLVIKGKGLFKYLSPGERGDLIININVQWEDIVV